MSAPCKQSVMVVKSYFS